MTPEEAWRLLVDCFSEGDIAVSAHYGLKTGSFWIVYWNGKSYCADTFSEVVRMMVF